MCPGEYNPISKWVLAMERDQGAVKKGQKLVELQLYYSHTRESLKKNHILLHRFMVTFYDLKHVIDLTRHRMLEGRRRVKS